MEVIRKMRYHALAPLRCTQPEGKDKGFDAKYQDQDNGHQPAHNRSSLSATDRQTL
jgi:hypothetical protein